MGGEHLCLVRQLFAVIHKGCFSNLHRALLLTKEREQTNLGRVPYTLVQSILSCHFCLERHYHTSCNPLCGHIVNQGTASNGKNLCTTMGYSLSALSFTLTCVVNALCDCVGLSVFPCWKHSASPLCQTLIPSLPSPLLLSPALPSSSLPSPSLFSPTPTASD